MTFTKEHIENLLQFNSEDSDCQANAEQWEVYELARMALASMTAEPVMYTVTFEGKIEEIGGDCQGFKREECQQYIEWLRDEDNQDGYAVAPLFTAPPAPVVPDEAIPQSIEILASTYAPRGVTYQWDKDECNAAADSWNACRAAMLQGAEPKRTDAIDSNLVEALRLVQCMLEDYRERNYGDAQGWIRHINNHMSEYSESHGDDAYSVLHDLLPAAPKTAK